jgi:hypothetical protein
MLGFSMSNTELDNFIVLESDRKYINLTHSANIKVYVGGILHSDKDFPAGRQSLDIPLNVEPSLIKLKISDNYGRIKTIAFDFGGNFSNHIPKSGQYLYFSGIGKNDDNRLKAYTGVNFGLDKLSKISLSADISAQNKSIGIQYFRLFSALNFDNTLIVSRANQTGASLKSKVFIPKINTHFSLDFQKNFTLADRKKTDQLEFATRVKFRPIKDLSLSVQTTVDFKQHQTNYNALAQYKFSQNLSATLSYERGGEMRFSLDFSPREDTQIRTLSTQNESQIGIKHYWNSEQSIGAQYYTDGAFLALEDKSSRFNNKIKFHKKNRTPLSAVASSQFSWVMGAGGASLAPSIGGAGFVMFEAGEGLEGAIKVSHSGQSCLITRHAKCVLKMPTERAIMPSYELDEVGFDSLISGIDEAILVPKKGGLLHIVDAHKIYFMQAVVLYNDKPVDLLIGALIGENDEKIDVFTDEQGAIFAQLSAGDYQLKLPGFMVKKITISAENVQEGVVDLGKISLNKK